MVQGPRRRKTAAQPRQISGSDSSGDVSQTARVDVTAASCWLSVSSSARIVPRAFDHCTQRHDEAALRRGSRHGLHLLFPGEYDGSISKRALFYL